MVVVPVQLPTASYDIHIGPAVLSHAGPLLRPFSLSRKAFLMSDPQVYHFHGEAVRKSLDQAGFAPVPFLVPPGEASKSLASARRLYDFLIKEGADRRSPIIALGGGVIGDLAGFVAATYMRGIPFIQLPTSLLAQIDSSVGGKVAINHPSAKNMIGAFYQPLLVLIDLDFLRTLPERELRAGMAEVIKYGVIADADFFSFLEANVKRILALDPDSLTHLIRRCCEIKASIVAQDEREEGIRALLNYGHTVGHALEAATRFRHYRHGEAVAIGMEAAGRISLSLGLWNEQEASRQHDLLKAVGLPLVLPVKPEMLVKWLKYDKKAREGTARFVLTRAIGDAIIRPLAEGVVLRALQGIWKGHGR